MSEAFAVRDKHEHGVIGSIAGNYVMIPWDGIIGMHMSPLKDRLYSVDTAAALSAYSHIVVDYAAMVTS